MPAVPAGQPASAPGRTIAIGDIHGCDQALEALLALIDPRPEDLLIVLGDVIDRGPETRQCIDRLIELKRSRRVVHLMGNHEEIFLDALRGGNWSQPWLTYGGREMLASYGGGFEAIPAAHLEFIRGGKEFFETPTHLFVHGNIRTHVPADEESTQVLRWDRFEPSRPRHVSGKRVICGHTAQRGGLPNVGPHYVCIDTCAYSPSGRLSALDVDADLMWQADQHGHTWPARPLKDVT
jgi:serine/threonine protein phosphatase 1